MKKTCCKSLVALCAACGAAYAETETSGTEEASVPTGWCVSSGNSASKAYDFFDAGNWDQGVVTGEFGAGLGTAKTKIYQWIKFGQDYSGQLFFTHASEAYLTLFGDGARDATWFVPGDVTFAANTWKGKVTFGATDENRKFFIDLGGGAPAFTLKGTGGYFFYNAISNGTFLVTKDSTAFVSFFNNGGFVDGDVRFLGKTTLQFDSSPSDATGVTRAKNFFHGGTYLEAKGGSVPTTDVIDGTLRILGSEAGIRYVQVYAPSTNTVLKAKSLAIDGGGLVCFRGTSLGTNDVDAAGAHILFDEAPTLVGGIIPQAIALASMDAATSSFVSFAGYDAERGVYPLDLEQDFVRDVELLVDGTENLLITNGTGTVTISGEKTVNSIILAGGSNDSVYTGLEKGDDAAKLRVTSGQVFVGWSRNKTPFVSVPVDFGNVHGCISFAADKQSSWYAPISGSGGVTFATLNDSLKNSGLNIYSDCDYTGDTYVSGSLYVSSGKKVFPSGERTGDLHVSGWVALWGMSSHGSTPLAYTINGLYGSGTIARQNYTVELKVGDNDSDGDFTGTVGLFYDVTKIGAGCQRFGGTVSCSHELNVEAGTLILDGTVVSNETSTISAVNVAADATIGGAGAIETALALAEGAKFVVETKASAPLSAASVTAEGPVVVSADSADWKDERAVLRTTTGTLEGIVFKRGANVGSLRLNADKTELLAGPKARGLLLIIR